MNKKAINTPEQISDVCHLIAGVVLEVKDLAPVIGSENALIVSIGARLRTVANLVDDLNGIEYDKAHKPSFKPYGERPITELIPALREVIEATIANKPAFEQMVAEIDKLGDLIAEAAK